MNWIQRLGLKCKIRFGTLEVKELENLCDIYISFQNPDEKAGEISLGSWKNVTKAESKDFLELHLKYHTADDGLFKADRLLKNEHIRHAYLHSLCTRKIPPTHAEEKWLLNCGEPGAMRCLKYQLSANSEYNLVQSGNFKMIENYIICHILRDSGEAQLANSASDREYPDKAAKYRELLKKYFEIQKDVYGKKLFTGFMAQLCLFADERNKEFIMDVIEQCDMKDYFLDNAIIRRMAFEMSPEYLTWYLAYSYIPDKNVIAELVCKGLPEHLRDMLTISEQRRTIHELCSYSFFIFSEDWHAEELEVVERFNNEINTRKRVTDLREYFLPRIKDGAASPAMSAWVAAVCPELAKDAQLCLTRYENRMMGKIICINPLDWHLMNR